MIAEGTGGVGILDVATPSATSLPAACAAPVGALAIVDQLLRDRAAVLARADAGRGLAPLARVLLATIALGAAMFGVALGSYRGGIQLAYAGLKVPLALIGTAAVCAPALTAVGRALGRPASLPRDLALLLAALARGALVLLALTPLVLAARAADLEYHRLVLLAAGCAALAAGGALSTLHAGVRRRGPGGLWTTLAVLSLVFTAVGAQAAWTLRPFVVRPQTVDVPFVRDLDGSLYDALRATMRSSMGFYEAAATNVEEATTRSADEARAPDVDAAPSSSSAGEAP